MKPYSKVFDTTKRQKKESWLGVPYAKKMRAKKKSVRQDNKKELNGQEKGST